MEKSALISEIEKTSNRASIYYYNDAIDRVFFEGNIIWEKDNKPHNVTDISSCLTRVGQSVSGGASGGVDSQGYESGPSYYFNRVEARYRATLKWTGGECWVNASYTGEINKLALPDGENITTLIVYKYRTGTQVIDVRGKNTITITDSGRASVDIHPVPANPVTSNGVSITVGVYKIEYKYT
jgi:hypothetical protein